VGCHRVGRAVAQPAARAQGRSSAALSCVGPRRVGNLGWCAAQAAVARAPGPASPGNRRLGATPCRRASRYAASCCVKISLSASDSAGATVAMSNSAASWSRGPESGAYALRGVRCNDRMVVRIDCGITRKRFQSDEACALALGEPQSCRLAGAARHKRWRRTRIQCFAEPSRTRQSPPGHQPEGRVRSRSCFVQKIAGQCAQ
jgi:hypothetical protein